MPAKATQRLLRAAACIAWAGCATPRAPTSVERVIDGVRVEGHFVSPFAYEHALRGMLAFERGSFEESIAEFELATTSAGEDAYLLAWVARAYARVGRLDAALARLDEGTRVDPRSEAIALVRGELEEERDRLDDAVDAYRRARDVAPDSIEPVRRLIAVHRRRGDQRAASAELTAFASRVRDRPTLALIALESSAAAGDRAAILTAARCALAVGPPTTRGRVQRLAAEAFAGGDMALANELLSLLGDHGAGRTAIDLDLAFGRLDAARLRLARARLDGDDGGARRWWSADAPAIAAELAALSGDPEGARYAADAAFVEGRPGEGLLRLSDAWQPRGDEALPDALGRILRALGVTALPRR